MTTLQEQFAQFFDTELESEAIRLRDILELREAGIIAPAEAADLIKDIAIVIEMKNKADLIQLKSNLLKIASVAAKLA